MLVNTNGTKPLPKTTSNGGNYVNYFFKEVKAFQMSKTMAKALVRMLPEFDNSLSHKDEAYATSWVPYRDDTKKDKATGLCEFNGFVKRYTGYSFWGAEGNKQSFLSRAMLTSDGDKLESGFIDRGLDPICDIRGYLWNQYKKHGAEHLGYLIDTKKHTGCPITKYRFIYAFNAYVKTSTADKDGKVTEFEGNAVISYTQKANSELLLMLDLEASKKDPEGLFTSFSDHKYGDITDPNEGCWLYPYEIITDSGQNPWGLYPSKEGAWEGFEQVAVTEDILAQRYNLNDDANVVNLRSYDEVLKIVVDSGLVPHEIIEAACGEFGPVPKATPKAGSTSMPGKKPAPAAGKAAAEDDEIPMEDTPVTPKKTTIGAPKATIGGVAPKPAIKSATAPKPAITPKAAITPKPVVTKPTAAPVEEAEEGDGSTQARYEELEAKVADGSATTEEMEEYVNLAAKG